MLLPNKGVSLNSVEDLDTEGVSINSIKTPSACLPFDYAQGDTLGIVLKL